MKKGDAFLAGLMVTIIIGTLLTKDFIRSNKESQLVAICSTAFVELFLFQANDKFTTFEACMQNMAELDNPDPEYIRKEKCSSLMPDPAELKAIENRVKTTLYRTKGCFKKDPYIQLYENPDESN